MSIKKWLHKRGVLGAIAKNAMDQYSKWRKKDNTLSEKEIAKNIFMLRYTNPNGVFDDNGKEKIGKYLSISFYPENLVEFCLISLDIEGNINPLDGDTYEELAGWLEDFLIDFGYLERQESEVLKDLKAKLNIKSYTISDFNVRWIDNMVRRKR